jgi:hypothetical protein
MYALGRTITTCEGIYEMRLKGRKLKRKRRKSTPRFPEQKEGGQDLNRIEPRTVDLPQGKEREPGD